MRDYLKFYIDGRWVDPATPKTLDVINPATEQVAGRISLGAQADVDAAVAAARRAFATWSQTSKEQRLAVLKDVVAEYNKRVGDVADAITEEMGAPAWLAQAAQAPVGIGHLMTTVHALEGFDFEEERGSSRVFKEAIGVCGFITPWNWPMNQVAAKVGPALAMGCTIVLKPSEIAPFSAYIFAEVLDAAGVPAGVFNLVNGEGPVVGGALAAHADVDMISITGSTRAGIEVATAAAATVKRVHQELGGKSPNIILDDADMAVAVASSVGSVMMNSGQSCMAPTRMIAPNSRMAEIVGLAKAAAEQWAPGDPTGNVKMGPVVSQGQWDRIQGFLNKGVEEGATLVTGGPGKPEGLETGYFVKPTVFAGVTNDMTIAREEIFGPVLVIIGYDTEEEAIRIANDTPYGLAGYVQSSDLDRAHRVASKIRAGYININNVDLDLSVPFGGYKRSGNGREFGDHAFSDYLELKSVLGFTGKPAGGHHPETDVAA
jgi:aldehyde dehydrogenase (NAD+)